MRKLCGRVQYGAEQIEYEVICGATRKTLTIEVHPDFRVIARAPSHTPPEVIEARVRRRAGWISKQIKRFGQWLPRTPPRRYVAGESHLYLGRSYRLRFAPAADRQVELHAGVLMVKSPHRLTPERARSAIDTWYRQQAKQIYEEVLAKWFSRFAQRGRLPPRIRVRAMRTRWGSLTAGGTMTLNLDLIRTARGCIEYVVLHELCHLQHRDHGPAFYQCLSELMPDWKSRKQRLEQALV